MGIVLGIQLDLMKSDSMEETYRQTQLDWRDVQLKSDYYKTNPKLEQYCDIMIEGNLDFADKVYAQGLELARYEEQSKIAPELRQEKTEYALLKFQFWLNAVELRETCRANYNTLLYFYKDDASRMEEIYQNTQSNILLEVKEEYGSEVMLVPLPVDLGLDSINLLAEQFGVEETPVVVINEEKVLHGVVSKQKITQELNSSSITTVA